MKFLLLSKSDNFRHCEQQRKPARKREAITLLRIAHVVAGRLIQSFCHTFLLRLRNDARTIRRCEQGWPKRLHQPISKLQSAHVMVRRLLQSFHYKYVYVYLCFAFLSSCQSSYKSLQPLQGNTQCVQQFKPIFKSDWYGTTVDVVGKHISGLLLFKAMPDSSTRIVFTNEVGVTFFDFEFGNNGTFKVHQVIAQLDRKPVINLLRKDFELIMMQPLKNRNPKAYTQNGEIFYAIHLKKETDYFITDKECASLLRIEKASKRKKKVEVILSGNRQQPPDSVKLKHFTFDMQISLKKLQR